MSSRLVLYGYFAILMLAGAFVLWIFPTWAGDGRLSFIDALFTAVSAAAVTGLITVNTASFDQAGQAIILLLIQLGGLGVIAFTTLYLRPRSRISLQRRAIIREYYVGSVEHDPRRIVRKVVLTTFAIEAIVTIALVPAFARLHVGRPVFTALFHAISAFCNAGFSTFADSLEGFTGAPQVTLPIIVAFVAGGLGFVVYEDLARMRYRHHVISLHTRVVLVSTAVLIVAGCVLFLVTEWNHAFAALPAGQRVMAALFQAVTPRTAGFDTVPQGDLSVPGNVATIVLMFTGGAPGSIAGGVKVTTVFLVVLAAFGRTDESGDARAFRRRIPAKVMSRASTFVIRALLTVTLSLFLLAFTETVIAGHAVAFRDLAFETFSAFGTVGLGTGITTTLSVPGKLVIIATMFAGRVGLISLAIGSSGKAWRGLIDYPHGEVLIG